MLSEKNRLRSRKDIEAVVLQKQGVFDPVCGIKYRLNNLAVTRVAVVAGTKVSLLAVKRNRVKRQYRHLIREILPKIKPGFDIILLTSKPALELDYGQKRERLAKVFQRARLFV